MTDQIVPTRVNVVESQVKLVLLQQTPTFASEQSPPNGKQFSPVGRDEVAEVTDAVVLVGATGLAEELLDESSSETQVRDVESQVKLVLLQQTPTFMSEQSPPNGKQFSPVARDEVVALLVNEGVVLV
ncbi:hypothetical protein H2204_009289 [Knufia peltigerae]|uniref:Uncharacterized protein n=1 Tax=Knufia peltigerae TaxID=1002370 RepID=A0AA39CW13_9EURO|nr:hypothetical protein H2204_009289 [Knufia peltigerae]